MTTNSYSKGMKDFLKLIDEKELYYQLISSSLFVSAYDILIETIIEEIKSMYLNGFNENGIITDPAYDVEVKGLCKKDIIKASLLWLLKNEVITNNDIEDVSLFRKLRNRISHEMSSMISDSDIKTEIESFDKMRSLRFKILKWWFINFEMEINTDLQHLKIEDLDFEELLSMKMFVFDYLHRTAIAEEEKINKHRN